MAKASVDRQSFATPLARLLRMSGLSGMVLLAACSEPPATVIDGSSPEAFERTTAAARRDLPDAERMIFDRALNTVAGRRHAVRDAEALARTTFDGMTASEIVADQRARN